MIQSPWNSLWFKCYANAILIRTQMSSTLVGRWVEDLCNRITMNFRLCTYYKFFILCILWMFFVFKDLWLKFFGTLKAWIQWNFDELKSLKFLEALELDPNRTLRLGRMIWMNIFHLQKFVVEVLRYFGGLNP